jgi:hypothetical protein
MNGRALEAGIELVEAVAREARPAAKELVFEAARALSGVRTVEPLAHSLAGRVENTLPVVHFKLLGEPEADLKPTFSMINIPASSESAKIHTSYLPSVVRVCSDFGTGSGYIAKNGLVVTADHVPVEDGEVSSNLSVLLSDGCERNQASLSRRWSRRLRASCLRKAGLKQNGMMS